MSQMVIQGPLPKNPQDTWERATSFEWCRQEFVEKTDGYTFPSSTCRWWRVDDISKWPCGDTKVGILSVCSNCARKFGIEW